MQNSKINKYYLSIILLFLLLNFGVSAHIYKFNENQIINESNSKFYLEKISSKKMDAKDRANYILYQFYGNIEYLEKIYYNK